jgi:phosphoribosylanthranilate isomerase
MVKSMHVKICGITNLGDALAACELGAWALGFNFYPDSPRYITPEAAQSIIAQLPPSVLTMGIFINQPLDTILDLKDQINLSFLQVYENYACPLALKQGMILVVQPKHLTDLPPTEVLQEYSMVLIDAPLDASCLLGGSGNQANWEVAKLLAPEVKLILAGGITPSNVKNAIEEVHPFAIDVCSGSEESPGKKDLIKMQSLFKKVR